MSVMSPVSYRINAIEYVAANRRLCVRRIGRSLGITLGMITALFFGFSIFSGSQFEIMPIAVGGAAGIIWLLVYVYLLLPRRAETLFREQSSLAEEMTLSLSEEGIEVEQASGVYRCTWANIVKWSEDKDLFLVYPTRYMMIWFPKLALKDERVEFMRKHMSASGLPQPNKLRKISK